MGDTIKSPAQVATSATTETDLYSVPLGAVAVASSLVVCNRGGAATTFRVSVAADAAVTATKDYLFYDKALPANETFVVTIGLLMDASDVLRVYAGNANLSFTLFYMERTP